MTSVPNLSILSQKLANPLPNLSLHFLIGIPFFVNRCVNVLKLLNIKWLGFLKGFQRVSRGFPEGSWGFPTAVMLELGRPGGATGLLTLFQLGEGRADYSHLLLMAPQKFFTFQHHCLAVKLNSIETYGPQLFGWNNLILGIVLPIHV